MSWTSAATSAGIGMYKGVPVFVRSRMTLLATLAK